MSDEQVMDQVPGGDTAPVESKEPVGDKPAESTKSASIPKSFDDMTEDQKQLYLLGAQHHKQYSEQEAAKKAKEAPAKKAPPGAAMTIPTRSQSAKLASLSTRP